MKLSKSDAASKAILTVKLNKKASQTDAAHQNQSLNIKIYSCQACSSLLMVFIFVWRYSLPTKKATNTTKEKI